MGVTLSPDRVGPRRRFTRLNVKAQRPLGKMDRIHAMATQANVHVSQCVIEPPVTPESNSSLRGTDVTTFAAAQTPYRSSLSSVSKTAYRSSLDHAYGALVPKYASSKARAIMAGARPWMVNRAIASSISAISCANSSDTTHDLGTVAKASRMDATRSACTIPRETISFARWVAKM